MVVLLGLIGYQRLSVRIPEDRRAHRQRQHWLQGRSPEVIESQITKTLEDSLSGIEGVNLITSNSRSSAATSRSASRSPKDPDVAAAEGCATRSPCVRARLPDAADEPVIAVEADSFPGDVVCADVETHNSAATLRRR